MKERILQHLELYPSIGFLRLVGDLGLDPRAEQDKLRVYAVVKELEREGLVEFIEEIGVVNYVPWKLGLVEAGYKLLEDRLDERRGKRGVVTLVDFFG
ncbi:MAG: hypothetical protein QW356_08855 [Candidatus Hadarchaeales archaeon]